MKYKVGDKVNKYTIESIVKIHNGKRNHVYYICHCICGTKRKIECSEIDKRLKDNCGCLKPAPLPKKKQTKLYMVWCTMRYRCNNKNKPNYKNYGGRGIKVCERWKDYALFLKDMGERPEGASLDRIDNNGNYEPSNCRWATREQQQSNTRRNVYIEYQGTVYTQSQLARLLGVSSKTIGRRFRKML